MTDRGADSRLLSTSESEIRQRELADRIREVGWQCESNDPFAVMTLDGLQNSSLPSRCY